jgi:DNA-binding beta-propeller fold protein YncE
MRFFKRAGIGAISFLALVIGLIEPGTIIVPSSFTAWAENNTVTNQKQRRIALVIGNSKYQQVLKLPNPVNDANDMAATLKELGFEVILRTDASLQDMDLALNEFSQKLHGGGVGAFFYAGHGVQMDGENYLIPVDAKLRIKTDIAYETLPVGKILGRMEEADNQTNIVILDACRNNPFGRGWSRSLESGLAQIIAPSGTFIAYATAPGKLAEDGEQGNGTFTQHILKYIKTPKLSIESLFKQVRQGVAIQTKNHQVPWDSSSLIGEFSFNPATEILEKQKINPPILTISTPKPTIFPDFLPSLATQKNISKTIPNKNLISYMPEKIELKRIFNKNKLSTSEGVAISNNGQVFISSNYSLVAKKNNIEIRDFSTGALIHNIKDTGYDNSLVVSPDSKLLVGGNFGQIIDIWDLSTGALLHSLKGHNGQIFQVAITPDGKSIVSSSSDNTVKIWNITTGKLVRSINTNHNDKVPSIAISSDSKLIVSGGAWDNLIKIWNIATGTLIRTIETGAIGWVKALAVSPDGKYIVSGHSENIIKVWDMATGKLLHSFIGSAYEYDGKNINSTSSLVVTPDSKIIVSRDNFDKIELWDLETKKHIKTIACNVRGNKNNIVVSSTGNQIISSCSGAIYVWEVSL